jgi:DNA-binding transcriptional LysR family regulator
MSDPDELRIADLRTFLTIVRLGSFSGAARALRVTPSQVSKAVSRLERQLRLQLLRRGARGVSVSDEGKRMLPQFEDLVGRLRALRAHHDSPEPELTVVGSAYINALFLPLIIEAQPQLRIRSIEVPPGVASAYATEHSFDLALTTSNERWPESWAKVRVGQLRKGLFASPAAARALAPVPVAPERLHEAVFIAPTYSYHGQLVPGDDGCPLHYGERRMGHSTQTLALALEVARRSEQLVFAPVLMAQPFVERGELVEVPVRGWDVRVPLYLACDAARVRAKVQKAILDVVRDALASEP